MGLFMEPSDLYIAPSFLDQQHFIFVLYFAILGMDKEFVGSNTHSVQEEGRRWRA